MQVASPGGSSGLGRAQLPRSLRARSPQSLRRWVTNLLEPARMLSLPAAPSVRSRQWSRPSGLAVIGRLGAWVVSTNNGRLTRFGLSAEVPLKSESRKCRPSHVRVVVDKAEIRRYEREDTIRSPRAGLSRGRANKISRPKWGNDILPNWTLVIAPFSPLHGRDCESRSSIFIRPDMIGLRLDRGCHPRTGWSGRSSTLSNGYGWLLALLPARRGRDNSRPSINGHPLNGPSFELALLARGIRASGEARRVGSCPESGCPGALLARSGTSDSRHMWRFSSSTSSGSLRSKVVVRREKPWGFP
jgi:hypothetical protein